MSMTPDYVRSVTNVLASEGRSKPFCADEFDALPDFRGPSSTKRLIAISSAAQVAQRGRDILEPFATKFLPNANPRDFGERMTSVLRRAILMSPGSDQRSAVVYSTLRWAAVSDLRTPLFAYQDRFFPRRVACNPTGWNDSLGVWSHLFTRECWALLDWHIPGDCDALKHFVMIVRKRRVLQRQLYPPTYWEHSALFGYADLSNEDHLRWLRKGWFPAQMRGKIERRVGDSMVVFPHPGITCGWTYPTAGFRDRRDASAQIHTYSLHPTTSRVVCVAMDNAFVGTRLALAADICNAVGRKMLV